MRERHARAFAAAAMKMVWRIPIRSVRAAEVEVEQTSTTPLR